jgi:hypothetical protein
MTAAASFTLYFTAAGYFNSFAKSLMGLLFWHPTDSLDQPDDINSPIFLRIWYTTETNFKRQPQNSCFLPISPFTSVLAKNQIYKNLDLQLLR